jgi:hypothetical protein
MLGFYPPEGQNEVAITNVGVATADGLPLEKAALVMSELQADGVPLEGDALVEAAREWAGRSGLTVGPESDAASPGTDQIKADAAANAQAKADAKAAADNAAAEEATAQAAADEAARLAAVAAGTTEQEAPIA